MQWILSSKGHLKRDSFLDMKEGSFIHKHIYAQHCMCVCENQLISIAWHFGHKRFSLKTHSHLSIFIDLFVCPSFIECNDSFNAVEVCMKEYFASPTSVKSCEWGSQKHMNRYLQTFGNVFGLFIAYIYHLFKTYILWDFVIYCEIFLKWTENFLDQNGRLGCQRK
jgi:hypothetical protein